MEVTIDQYLSFLCSVELLRKLWIDVFMVVWSKIIVNLVVRLVLHANHSINHALKSLTESVKHTLDNKRFGCDIFIDLKKAFDTVHHPILLENLSTMVLEEWPYLGNSMFL